MVRGHSRRTTRRSKVEKEKQEAASAASSVAGSAEESGDEEEEKEEKKPTRRSRRTRKPTTKVAAATGQSKRGTTKSDKESQEECSGREDGSGDEKGSKDESDSENNFKNNGDSKEESKNDLIDEEDENSSNENGSDSEAEKIDKGSEVEEPPIKEAKGRRGAVAKKSGVKGGGMRPLSRVTRKRSRVQSEGEGEKKPPSLRRGKRAARASEDESQSSNMPPETKRRRTRRGKQQEDKDKKKASEDEAGSHREKDPGNDKDGSEEEKSGSHKDEESGDEDESREASSNDEVESDKEDEVKPTSRRTRGRRKQTRSKPSAGKSKQGKKESDDNGNKAKAARPKRGRPKKMEEKEDEERAAAENDSASEEQDDKAYDSAESDEIVSKGRLAKQEDKESSNENMSDTGEGGESEDDDARSKSATPIRDGEDAQMVDEAPKKRKDGTFTKKEEAKEDEDRQECPGVESKENEKPAIVEDEEGVKPTEMKVNSEKQDQVEHEDDESEKSTEVEDVDDKGEKQTKVKDVAVEVDRPSLGTDKRGGPSGSKGEDRTDLEDKDVRKSAETEGKEEHAELQNENTGTTTEIEASESKKQIRVKEKASEKPTEVEEKRNGKPSEVGDKGSEKHSETAAKKSWRSYAVENEGSINPAEVDEEQRIKSTEADGKVSSGKGEVGAIPEEVEGKGLSESIAGDHRRTESFQNESNEIGNRSEKVTGEESIRKTGTEGTNLGELPAERLTVKMQSTQKRAEIDLAGNSEGRNSDFREIAEGDTEESPKMEDPEDVVEADVPHGHASSRDKGVHKMEAISDAKGSTTKVETSNVDTSGEQGETEAVQKGALDGMPANNNMITDKSAAVAPNARKDIGINEDAMFGLTVDATNKGDDDAIGTEDAKKVGKKLDSAADMDRVETKADVVAERPQNEPEEELDIERIQSSKTENALPSSVSASNPAIAELGEKTNRDPPGEVISSTVPERGTNEIGIKPMHDGILGQRSDSNAEDADSFHTPEEEIEKADETERTEGDGPPKSTLSSKADEDTLDGTERSSQKEGTWLAEIAQSAEKTEAMKATSEPALKGDDLRTEKVGNHQIDEKIGISASLKSQSEILRSLSSDRDPSEKGHFENAKNDEKEKFDNNDESATLLPPSTLEKEVIELDLQNSENSGQETPTLCAGLKGPDPLNKENWDSPFSAKPDHEMDEAGPSDDGNVRFDELETADAKPPGESPIPRKRSDIQSTRKILHIPNRCNLDRIKMLLFTIGGQTHKGRGFERLFSDYWGALSRIVAGNQSDPETTRLRVVIKSFLKTKRLKKLHNRLVMALINRSLQETVPLSEVSGHIPSSIRNRVKLVNAEEQTFSVKAEPKLTRALVKRPENEEPKSTAIFSSVPLNPYTSLYSEKAGSPSEQLNTPSASPSLPGALVVDPFVRDLVKSEGLRVSENAVWLFVVAIREYTKSMINRAILSKEARRKNQIPPKKPENMQLTPKMNSVSKGKSPDPKQSNIVRVPGGASKLTLTHDNVISVQDLVLLSSNMRVGSVNSLGGTISRLACERCLFAPADSNRATRSSGFSDVHNFLTTQISSAASERQKALKAERLAKSTAAKSSVGGDASTSKAGHTAATSKPAAPISENRNDPPKVVQKQTVRSAVPGQGLGRGAKNLGLGRGAKNLAALKARTAVAQASGTAKPPDTVDPTRIQKESATTAAASTLSQVQPSAAVNPSSSKGPEDLPSSKDSEAPPSTSVQQNRPVGNPNQVVKRGKGLGKKNLAAMRARVAGSSGGEAQADENAKETSDIPASAAHSAELPAAAKQTPMQPQLAAVTSKAPPSTSTSVTEVDPQPTVRGSQEGPATLPRADETVLIPNSDETGGGGARDVVVTKIYGPPISDQSVSSKPTDVVAAVEERTTSTEVSTAAVDEERKFLPLAKSGSIDTPASTAEEPATSTMLGATSGSKSNDDKSELVTSGTTVESIKIDAPPASEASSKADVSSKDAIQKNDHRFEPKESWKLAGSEGSKDRNGTEAAIIDKEDSLVSPTRESAAVAENKVILDASRAALENENKLDISGTLVGDSKSDKTPAETKALDKAEKKQDSTPAAVAVAAAASATSPPPDSAAIDEMKSDMDKDDANPGSK